MSLFTFDIDSGSDADPWLTVAEFAEAMRVRPVTVRSWIAKGLLKATRAGQRKWLIRQSELSRMLEADVPDAPPPEVYEEMVALNSDARAERAAHDELAAEYELHVALEQSRMAPPDARFPSRIRQIAMAAAWRAASIRERLSESEYVWAPVPNSAGMTLSYELRPGGIGPDLATAGSDLTVWSPDWGRRWRGPRRAPSRAHCRILPLR